MFAIGIVGWISIILCRIICIATVKDFSALYSNIDSEIIADGNNLFSTVAGYVFLGFWALCITNLVPIISYIIIGIMFLCCIPSALTILTLFKNPPHITTAMLFLSGLINTFTPISMTYFLLSNYII